MLKEFDPQSRPFTENLLAYRAAIGANLNKRPTAYECESTGLRKSLMFCPCQEFDGTKWLMPEKITNREDYFTCDSGMIKLPTAALVRSATTTRKVAAPSFHWTSLLKIMPDFE
jgi:hypothetical protein